MRQLFVSAVMVLSLFTVRAHAPFKLWYDRPSGTTWENAYLLVKYRLAAAGSWQCRTGHPATHESTVWTGSPNRTTVLMPWHPSAYLKQVDLDVIKKQSPEMAHRPSK